MMIAQFIQLTIIKMKNCCCKRSSLEIFISITVICCNLVFVQSENCKSQKVFGPLPGNGWDILRNKEMSRIVLFNYEGCQQVADGSIIPDNVQVFPVQKSGLQMFSEIIDHWRDFTSVTANSYSLSAGYKGIGASYSPEFQNLKRNQVSGNSVTCRSSARYVVNSLGVEQSSLVSLEPSFEALIKDAANSFETERSKKAELLLELLVLNYGTHVTTRIDVGACLIKEDFLTRSFMANNAENRIAITVAASISFYDKFQFGASYSDSSSTSLLNAMNRSTTSSSITSLGGDLLKPNDKIDVWIKTIPENLVTIDRDGIALPNLITPYGFPEINLTTLHWVRAKLERVIEEYYAANTREGCMNEESANFDYNANVENANICTAPANNYTFGGVFQTCKSSKQVVCNNYTINNINTGSTSCPPGYQAVLIANSTISVKNCGNGCFLICGPDCIQVPVTYTTYWCAGRPGQKANELLFGGIFSSVKENMLTLAKSCPPNFEIVQLLHDFELKICVSNNFELGRKYSVPFAGFFSCSKGNYFSNGSKGCPPGFSQQMAVIEQDCMINYCVKANTMGMQPLPIVVPPFKKFDVLFEEEEIQEIFSQSKGYYGPKSTGNFAISNSITHTCFIMGLTMLLLYGLN